MQNTENKEIWTALYARLSMDDGNVGESMSKIGRASCRERV